MVELVRSALDFRTLDDICALRSILAPDADDPTAFKRLINRMRIAGCHQADFSERISAYFKLFPLPDNILRTLSLEVAAKQFKKHNNPFIDNKRQEEYRPHRGPSNLWLLIGEQAKLQQKNRSKE